MKITFSSFGTVLAFFAENGNCISLLVICSFIGNCDAISYYKKTRPEDAQTAEMELIAAQYRGRARVLQAKLFVHKK